MIGVTRLNILTDLGFQILKTSPSDENVNFSALSILLSLQYCLQGSRSEEFVDQINFLLKLPKDEKENNSMLISELMKGIIYGDPQFVTIALACGVYTSRPTECIDYSKLDNIIYCEVSHSVKECNDLILKRSERFQNFLMDDEKPKNGTSLFSGMDFKAPFLNIFNIGSTVVKEFHVSTSRVINVQMMQRGGMILYNEDEEIGLRMMKHYFYGGNFYIVVMVPKNRFGLTDMEKKLTGEAYDHLLKNMRTVHGRLSIPKLSLDHRSDLRSLLEALGLNLDHSNDRTDHFVHKVSTNLNEFGSNLPMRKYTESEMRGVCLSGFTKPPERQEIVADEPFLLSINHVKDNSLILLSRVFLPLPVVE